MNTRLLFGSPSVERSCRLFFVLCLACRSLWERNAVTLPKSDAQSLMSLSSQARPAFAAHSIPAGFSSPAAPVMPPTPASALPLAETDSSSSVAPDFSHSWDLATGGFKTLTAKRTLPPPQQRRGPITPTPETAPSHASMFLLVLLACIVVMLVSAGVVLFMTLQP